MCTYSMIADHYRDKFQHDYNWITLPQVPEISRAELDQLRRDVEEMKALLKRAKKYDADNGEPDCEMDEKVALIKKVAELVGVDLSDVAP